MAALPPATDRRPRADDESSLADFIIDGFNKNLLTTANVKNPNDSSIYLTDLGTDGKIDKFTVVGTVAPARVFVSALGADGVLIDYTGGKIPAGGTGYIVGVFSERRPRIDRGVAVNGKLVDVEFFTAVPEPGSFCLLAIGAGAVVGIRTILQRRARGRPGLA